MFCFCFALNEFPRALPNWFTIYQWRTGKGWLMMYLILLPHILALFMSCFEYFLMFIFNKQDEKSIRKLLCVHIKKNIYQFLLIGPCPSSLVWFPFKIHYKEQQKRSSQTRIRNKQARVGLNHGHSTLLLPVRSLRHCSNNREVPMMLSEDDVQQDFMQLVSKASMQK